jgi:hypothetical protein
MINAWAARSDATASRAVPRCCFPQRQEPVHRLVWIDRFSAPLRQLSHDNFKFRPAWHASSIKNAINLFMAYCHSTVTLDHSTCDPAGPWLACIPVKVVKRENKVA